MKTLLLSIVATLLLTPKILPGGQAAPANLSPEVAKLNALLTSTASQKDKADACRELARIGTKESIGPLSTLLNDASLAHMARYALEPIPDPGVDEAFRAALARFKGLQLVGVIGSVGVRRDAKAIPLLAGLLHDPDGEIVQATARALGNIGSNMAAKTLKESLPRAAITNQLAYYEGLFRCAEALAKTGQRSQAVEIYDMLRTNQRYPQVRAGALRGAVLQRKDGLSLLIQVLQSADYGLFAAAVHTTLEMPGGLVTQALTEALNGLPPERQVLIIQMLGKRNDPRAVPVLVKACRNAPQVVRLEAVRALGQINDPACLAELTGLLIDPNAEVAREALECQGAMQGSEFDTAALNLLNHSEPRLRVAGMELAVRRRLPQAKPLLYQIAKGNDPRFRNVAIRRLADLAQPSDLPEFLNLLSSASGREELEAAEEAAIVVIKKEENPERCVETVQPYWAKATEEQRGALLHILGAAGGPHALEIVTTAAQNTNATIHAIAVRVLAGWNSVDAAPALLALARQGDNSADKTIGLRGYLNLATHGELPVEQRLEMCREAAGIVQRDEEKKQLLAALSALNSPAALAMLQPYLEDESTRSEAGAAFVTVAGKILEDPKSPTTAEMREGLGKLADSTANPDLAKRAKKLLEIAKARN